MFKRILVIFAVFGLIFSSRMPAKAQDYTWPGEEIIYDILPLEENGPEFIFIRYTGFGDRPADLVSFMSSEPIVLLDFGSPCSLDGAQKANCQVQKDSVSGLYLAGIYVPLSEEGNIIYVQLTWLDGGMLELPFCINCEEDVATAEPTEEATAEPTEEATPEPTDEATLEPTEEATAEPVEEATPEPTEEATAEPVEEATPEPTEEATAEPVEEATAEPTQEWTPSPVETPEPVVVETPKPVTTPVVTEEPTTEIPVEGPPVVVTVEPVETPQAPTAEEVVAQPSPIHQTFFPALSR